MRRRRGAGGLGDPRRELRARRDRLAAESAAREAARRDAENRRARAEASTLIAEERMARADRDVASLGERERALAERARRAPRRGRGERRPPRRPRARPSPRSTPPTPSTGTGSRRPSATRRPPASACGPPTPGLRAADHVALEARLGLEALHEGIVVELAGLGDLAIARLAEAAGVAEPRRRRAGDADAADRRPRPTPATTSCPTKPSRSRRPSRS